MSGVVTVLRGFKVPLPVLDAFLLAHDVYESELLCVGSGDTQTRVFLPARECYTQATSAYIAFDWKIVFAQRRFDDGDLAENPPAGFEELRKEVLSYATASDGPESLANDPRYQNALYVVITEDRTYIPLEMRQRDEADILTLPENM